MAAACLQLCSLDISRCFQVTDNGVGKLAEHYRQLSSFDLGGCFEVTDEALGKLAEGCSIKALLAQPVGLLPSG